MNISKNKLHDVFLQRKNLHALLEKGLNKALITITAGPGYGKSSTVARFLADRNECIVWLNLTKLDNITVHFWDNFLKTIRDVAPEMTNSFRRIGFPNTSGKLDTVLHLLTNELYDGEAFIFVVDGFHNINNKEILLSFEYFLEMNPLNFCLILISNENIKLNINYDNCTSITANDLKFSEEEVKDFISMHGITYSEQLQKPLDKIDGWPLALKLFLKHSLQHAIDQDYHEENKIFNLKKLFTEEYFDNFAEKTRKTLVQLSHFHYFPKRFLQSLQDKQVFDAIAQNTFVAYDKNAEIFHFQEIYHDFLIEKRHLLNADEVKEIYSLAGAYCLEEGLHYLALDCYFKCQDYDNCIKVLLQPMGRLDKTLCDIILGYVDALPAEMQESNIMVDYIKAFLLLNNLKVTQSRAIFHKLKLKLESKEKTVEENYLLGEIYMALADICMLSSDPLFETYYKKASELLPGGSRMRTKDIMLLGNNNSFFLIENKPNELQPLLDKVFSAAYYADKINNGSGFGFESLYAAEAAYLTCDFEKAKEYCSKAIYRAFSEEQHDIVCSSYMLIAKIALAEGDYETAENQVNKVVSYINANEIVELFDMRDCGQSWLHIMTGNLDKVSNWVTSSSRYYANAPIDTGRNFYIHLMHLYAKNEYQEADNYLVQIESLFEEKSLWYLRLKFNIYHALCLIKLDNKDKALAYFIKAYEMSYHNNIFMPFIEFGYDLYVLLDLAIECDTYEFDKVWLDELLHKTELYEKNFMKAVYECNKESRVQAVPENLLSREELEILIQLAQGFTKDQIGQTINCNVRKKCVEIYKKLGAANRMEAIRLAKSRKYI